MANWSPADNKVGPANAKLLKLTTPGFGKKLDRFIPANVSEFRTMPLGFSGSPLL